MRPLLQINLAHKRCSQSAWTVKLQLVSGCLHSALCSPVPSAPTYLLSSFSLPTYISNTFTEWKSSSLHPRWSLAVITSGANHFHILESVSSPFTFRVVWTEALCLHHKVTIFLHYSSLSPSTFHLQAAANHPASFNNTSSTPPSVFFSLCGSLICRYEALN